MLVCAR
jgi:hypothetical protein